MTDQYFDYIHSDAWQAKRLQRLAIARFKCAACDCKELDVHHLTYDRLGNENMEDLLPLCRFHHDVVEAAKKSGSLRTIGHPLFLLTETMQAIWRCSQPIEKRVVASVPVRNPVQSNLIQELWFIRALKLSRKSFLKLCRRNFKGRGKGKMCANAIALWERNRNTP